MKTFDNFNDDCQTALREVGGQVEIRNTTDKFKWLQKYRRDDESAIDRNIADGTVTLQRRESRFREELERHEHEYIVYKDFT